MYYDVRFEGVIRVVFYSALVHAHPWVPHAAAGELEPEKLEVLEHKVCHSRASCTGRHAQDRDDKPAQTGLVLGGKQVPW